MRSFPLGSAGPVPGARPLRRLLLLGLVLTLSGAWACQSFWQGVRERERHFSIDHARDAAQRGNCGSAMVSLERAQSSGDLGSFEAESIWLKARCLERLGRHRESLGHLRMLGDFHADSPYADALPEPVTHELAALPLADAKKSAGKLSTPSNLKIPRARYSRAADRYQLTGSVRVLYSVERDGSLTDLRVIESAHPLLASWALESLAGAERKDDDKKLAASRRGASDFVFASKWEGSEEDGEPWIVFFPKRDDP